MIHRATYFYSIDATDNPRFCAFVNDSTSKYANCVMQKKVFDGVPRLCLYTRKTINAAEELRYDYGAPNLWWRKTVCFFPKLSRVYIYIENNNFVQIYNVSISTEKTIIGINLLPSQPNSGIYI